MSYADKKVTIIGLGFLMEYIFPCFRKAMGDRVKEQINAVTADEADLEGKKERLGIKVYLNDNAKALRDMEPDLIFFAPPPPVAPVLTESVLKDYFGELRESGKKLPKLIAFPPSPKGAYYQEQLGDDLKVVNIIPNMVSRVGSEMIPTEHCHMVTYPERDNFTDEEKQELKEFLAPMGRYLDIPPQLIIQVLSAEIACHPLTEIADIAARKLTEHGIVCDYRQAAGVMRAHHQKKRGYTSPGTNDCRVDLIGDKKAVELLSGMIDSWYDSLFDYLIEEGFPYDKTKSLFDPRFDILLHEAQVETREEIVAKAKKDATKGGMTELCMERYYANVEPVIAEEIDLMAEGKAGDPGRIGRLMAEITKAVVERGTGLTRNKELTIGAGHHAVLFGALAEGVLSAFGDKGKELLEKAVIRYGNERGQRMAKRALKNGDPLDMASYFAYGEWGVTGGFEKTAPKKDCPYLHYHVTKCPWCTAWEEAHMMEYGQYYCRSVDAAILQGFNPELKMELPVWHSMPGADHCDFNWLDAENTEERVSRQKEIAARIGDSAKKDFRYHSAHEYSVVMDEVKKADPGLYRKVEESVWKAFTRSFSHTELLMILDGAGADFLLTD